MIGACLMLPQLVLLVSIGDAGDMTAEDHRSEAVEVYRCGFEAQSDVNHDLWPDHWKRRRGPGFPTFLAIELQPDEGETDSRHLRVQLDGGAAAVFSPPIAISPMFSYVLEADVATGQLESDVAYLSVTFLDAQGNLLAERPTSNLAAGTTPGSRLRIGPFSPSDARAAQAVIGLHVEPQGRGFDLKGFATFDNILLARLPRMTLHSNSTYNVYTDPKDVEITCRVSGIHQRDPLMTFELVDLSRQTLAEMKKHLDGEVVALQSTQLERIDAAAEGDATGSESDRGYKGQMTWRPPIESYGYYQVRVRMMGGSGVKYERSISLAIVRPMPRPTGGEFGWSLPHGDRPLPLAALSGLLGQVSVNWVKFPVWYDESEKARADELAHFIERLNMQQIELVGVLDQPPPGIRPMFGEGDDHLPAATVFAERDIWLPAINQVLTRLSLKVQWWQLGGDDDTTFMGHTDLESGLGEVFDQMGRLGQQVHLGIGWRWLNELPQLSKHLHPTFNLSASPPLMAEELATYLKEDAPSQDRRWVMLQPLPKAHYAVDERARDLVLRMLAAKMNGENVVFAADPFDEQTGLMNPDGTPGELLLPWRTTAHMISDTEHIGRIALPGGSNNFILSRGEEAIMVIWNEKTADEVINLGDPEAIEVVDLWGRVAKPQQQQHRQVYHVGPLPMFITGISREMALWRMSFQFTQARLQSVYGRPQFPEYEMENPFRQGVSGEMRINTPEAWGRPPDPIRINMAGGEQRKSPFEIQLRGDASTGEQPVRVDFSLIADRDYQFSVWRTMEVGLGDISMEFTSRLDDKGNVVVEQRMTNRTEQYANFKCFLFAPGRRRLRQNVLNLSLGSNLKIYTIPEGEDLVGQTIWVRAEEMAGDRVLNYRFVVEP
ncbi:MAG: hypothetical protein KDA41_21060 [Planctomycetales bacterium]|nr:hypothetical protein [Planctomycetales bacterium]